VLVGVCLVCPVVGGVCCPVLGVFWCAVAGRGCFGFVYGCGGFWLVLLMVVGVYNCVCYCGLFLVGACT